MTLVLRPQGSLFNGKDKLFLFLHIQFNMKQRARPLSLPKGSSPAGTEFIFRDDAVCGLITAACGGLLDCVWIAAATCTGKKQN